MLSSKEDSCCKHKKLVTGNEATVHLVAEIAILQ